MLNPKFQELQQIANKIRILTVKCIGQLGVGHIGGSVSLPELLAVLYFDVMRVDPQNPKWKDRDLFVLSKGHGGPALYATLALKGFIPEEQLSTLNRPNTDLPSHCDRLHTPGVDMSTGSLGQGFSVAVGIAQALKMDHCDDRYVYAVIGDGESQEGQIWEAALLAGSLHLDKLIAFTDYNKMQLDGYVEDINGLYPLTDKWKAFNWHTQHVDGHDVEAIWKAVDEAKKIKNRPSMIILNTIKGKGCYFCENQVSSHNMSITPDMWQKAVKDLEGGC